MLQSGFPEDVKAAWLGTADLEENRTHLTNVPNLRIAYRRRVFQEEMHLLHGNVARFMASIGGP